MNKIRQFAGQTLIYGLGHILSRIVFFLLITVYLTYRLKDTFQYGIYTDLYAYAALLIVLFSLRLDTAYFRFGSRPDTQTDALGSAFLPIIFSSALVLALGNVFAQPIAVMLEYPESPHYVRWFSIIMALDIMALLPYAHLRLSNKARSFVKFKVFNVMLTMALVLLFLEVIPLTLLKTYPVFSGIQFEIDLVFIANLISSAVILLLLVINMRRVRFGFNSTLCKKMIYYALPLVLVGVCGQFNQYFAVPLQKYFLGNGVVENLSSGGIYGGSQKIASIFLLFTTAFNYAAEPFFFNNAEENSREAYYGKICRLFTLLGGVLILTIFLGIDIFKYMIESSFHEGVVVIPILLLSYLFLGLYYNVSIWYKLADKTMYGALISLVGVVITSFISIYFLPKVGFIASAWAALATFLSMLILAYLIGRKVFPISYPVKAIIRDIGLIVCFMLISYAARQYLHQVFYWLINILLWIVFIYFVWVQEKSEWLGIIKNRSSGNL